MSHLTLVVSQDVVEHVSVPSPGLVVLTEGPQLPTLREELRLTWEGFSRVGVASRRLFSKRARSGGAVRIYPLVAEPEPFQLYLVG